MSITLLETVRYTLTNSNSNFLKSIKYRVHKVVVKRFSNLWMARKRHKSRHYNRVGTLNSYIQLYYLIVKINKL